MRGVRRQIVALGGGGFSMEAGNPLLDDYVLGLARRERPRVCFLPSASGDADHYIVRFYQAFSSERCEPSHVSLFRRGGGRDLREQLLAQDLIYVGGGSLANLLAIWRVHALDEALPEAWERGIVLCGVSAGSMCWFEDAVTRSHGGSRTAQGLGLLPGSNSVHYSSDPERRACYRTAVLDGLPAGYGADDGVGLLFAGRELADVVSARPDARAWRVEAGEGGLVEVAISPRLLKPVPEASDAPVEIAEFRDARRARQAGTRRSRPA